MDHPWSPGHCLQPSSFVPVGEPLSAPDFIRHSPLAYADGANEVWLEVDIHTLQHKRYPTIFGLDDATALSTAKTGAVIRKQAPVVVANILQRIKDRSLAKEPYGGYSSCPLVTGHGKMLLAAFKYDNLCDSDPFLKPSSTWPSRCGACGCCRSTRCLGCTGTR